MVYVYIESRKEDEVSNRTIKEEHRQFKNFFDWAIEQHLCTENPVKEIPSPKIVKKKPRYFTIKELEAIFANSREPYTAIFRFMFFTGLRSGETSNLKWEDWDEENKTLTIRVVSANKKKITPGNKTKREETIPLNNDAMRILEQRKDANDSDTFVFLNEGGNRLDNENIYRNLKRVAKNCKIINAHPHVFRHTFASHLVIKGVSLYIVKELLRHKSIKETEIYAHLSQESTRAGVKLLENVL